MVCKITRVEDLERRLMESELEAVILAKASYALASAAAAIVGDIGEGSYDRLKNSVVFSDALNALMSALDFYNARRLTREV